MFPERIQCTGELYGASESRLADRMHYLEGELELTIYDTLRPGQKPPAGRQTGPVCHCIGVRGAAERTYVQDCAAHRCEGGEAQTSRAG
jgi:hypothetical protein